MKKLFLFSMLFIISGKIVLAQDTTLLRAPHWYSFGQMGQVAFLYGFWDGLSLGNGLAFSYIDPATECYKKANSANYPLAALERIRLMDIQDQIDSLYSDSLNVFITIPHAFWISVSRLSENNTLKTNKLIERYRDEDHLDIFSPRKNNKKTKNK